MGISHLVSTVNGGHWLADMCLAGSYTEHFHCAGSEKGDILLFEPSTSEHMSSRTIFDPITSLAPSSDCRTFAIGYILLTHVVT